MGSSTWLGAEPYERLRGAAFLFLSEVGHVVRATVVSDEGGGATTTWAADSADVPCRVDAIGSSEALVAAMISEQSSHVIAIPTGFAVDVGDRFEVDGRGMFAITGLPHRTGETLRSLEAVQV